ncbi:hypothetical protein MLD38_033632 [Melastoma candidum]|uniref:Uncharacterized protein n=1 Tax=Melastoma candidum TaxID=119954 RepID=A0ACB9M7Z0_9MYRT|nr:hypothetical protein MLD38_033632 [Melastoma candidum]
MFKKAVEAKTQQRLSGADKKKLRRTLRDRFPVCSDDHLDSLLPPKAEITVTKLQNRVHVFGVEGEFPMFFDIDGRGSDLFPSVYAMWRVPEILPAFTLKGGEVSRFVIGGADLMFPGISIPPEGLPSFTAGEPWAIKVPGNPAPIAVGSTTMSSSEAMKAGLRGKALKVMHSYRDFLWESAEAPCTPNAGFLEDVVFEDPTFVSTSFQSEVVNDASNCVQYVACDKEADNVVCPPDDEPTGTAIAVGEVDGSMQLNVSLEDLKVTEGSIADLSTSEDQLNLSAKDVDALLDNCLLQALYTSVKDKDLPIPGSTLWSNHVLPCRPTGITLDIKKSSYKKLSKWLQAKSSAGLVSVKEDKYKKEVVLLGINRNHPDYVSFKPEKRTLEKTGQLVEHGTEENGTRKTLEVLEVYKASAHAGAVLAAVGVDMGKLFSASEISDIVHRYVEQENLVKPADKSYVILDAVLCDALYKGAVKKGSAYPTEIHKKDLGITFIGRMQPHHIVARGNDSVVRKGALKPIQIMTERRQGNKKVTRLSGLEVFLVDPESLASELQKKFACSTTVAELPGKKGFEVLVQGGVIEDLSRHLIEQYGIPKKYIEVLDKTKK